VMSEAHQGIPPHSFKKPPGVEEPTPPFQLQAPHLSYESHPDGVLLKWQQQPAQVTYQVFRAEGGNFVKVADLPAGSTSWKDPSALPPQDDGFDLGDLFGGGGEKKKVYRYKVVAIDTQATDPANKEKSSEITVELKSGKKEEKPKFDKNNDGIDDREQDSDGDGVNDHEDKFPNDPTRTGKEQDGGGNGDHGDGGPGRGDGDNGDGNNGNGNGNTGGWPF
jgi:penicillin-binding protein 2A